MGQTNSQIMAPRLTMEGVFDEEMVALKPGQIQKPPIAFPKFDDIPDEDTQIGAGSKINSTFLDGARKSVLIGINYVGMNGELRGCINDVHRMRAFIERNGFPDGHEQFILTDEPDDEFLGYPHLQHAQPSKENILYALRWLVKDVQPGDSLFLHYSGHGVRVPDTSGDEQDGMDESIVPLDYQKYGVVIDDLLHAVLVEPLPEGSRLTVLMDCCHSGSGLDLPLIFEAFTEDDCYNVKKGQANMHKNRGLHTRNERVAKSKQKLESMVQDRNITLVGTGTIPPPPALPSVEADTPSKKGKVKKESNASSPTPVPMTTAQAARECKVGRVKLWQHKKDILDMATDEDEREMMKRALGMCDDVNVTSRGIGGVEEEEDDGDHIAKGCCVLFSGCQDEQTAGDVSDTRMFDLPPATGPEGAGGACTAAFIQTLTNDPHISYIDVLLGMRKDLREKGFKQIPEISSTVGFDLNNQFDMER
eukprot:GHVN01035678.1.p1 GENE.GHVN01035678.1~~GHVN01035678.1.p1  ORF type:complete len:487 (-),score=112.75 GHVN01035678.1:1911-3341(-)